MKLNDKVKVVNVDKDKHFKYSKYLGEVGRVIKKPELQDDWYSWKHDTQYIKFKNGKKEIFYESELMVLKEPHKCYGLV